eukprot:1157326-Pelagomonas_calceolata.AAC.3
MPGVHLCFLLYVQVSLPLPCQTLLVRAGFLSCCAQHTPGCAPAFVQVQCKLQGCSNLVACSRYAKGQTRKGQVKRVEHLSKEALRRVE